MVFVLQHENQVCDLQSEVCIIDTIAGFFGGGIGGIILQAFGLFNQAAGTGVNMESILANIGSGGGGGGGAIVMIIVAFIKSAMNKNA